MLKISIKVTNVNICRFVPEKLSEVAIIESLDFEICESDLRYEILLSDKGQEGKYKSIYNGESLSCCIQDLKPNQEYSVCLKVHLDEFQVCFYEKKNKFNISKIYIKILIIFVFDF